MKNRYLIATDSIIRAGIYRSISVILLFFLLATFTRRADAQESVLDQKISIASQESTIYEVFNQITSITGYYFIYDSKLLNSDKKVKVAPEEKTLQQYLTEILDDKTLGFKIIEKHILIFKREEQKLIEHPVRKDSLKTLVIGGRIIDKQTQKPLPFVSIGIIEQNIGTISNFDGFFILKLPHQLLNSVITISHLGYKSQSIPVQALLEKKVDIFLETEYISIQEVIIRNVDSREVIKKVFANRFYNYPREPIYITSFYREGVLRDSKYLNYSEAIVKIFKSPVARGFESDQVKLLQSRKVINIDQKDTLIVKIKAGLRSSLTLDIVKNLPDFIDPDFIDNYNYSRVDIISVNSRNAYAIDFEQKENVYEPLFKGTLYIDMETFALVSATFEMNPKYVKETVDMFVLKKSRKYNITPEKINYSVNYNYSNGKYYLGHIRGDLTINYKKRYRIFSNDFHVFLEMANCKIDTLNVQRFPREEVLKVNRVFLDTKFNFDQTYWGDYNIITPEEKISQALSRINSKMEFVKPE